MNTPDVASLHPRSGNPLGEALTPLMRVGIKTIRIESLIGSLVVHQGPKVGR